MEVCSAPSKLPPPEHWWSPLEYAPNSASEKDTSASEKEELDFGSESEEVDVSNILDSNAGSEADTASDELDVDREAEDITKKITPGGDSGMKQKGEQSPYDKIESFMRNLKSQLDEAKPKHTQVAGSDLEAPKPKPLLQKVEQVENVRAEDSSVDSSEPDQSQTLNMQVYGPWHLEHDLDLSSELQCLLAGNNGGNDLQRRASVEGAPFDIPGPQRKSGDFAG
jgi:hypothetical protein